MNSGLSSSSSDGSSLKGLPIYISFSVSSLIDLTLAGIPCGTLCSALPCLWNLPQLPGVYIRKSSLSGNTYQGYILPLC